MGMTVIVSPLFTVAIWDPFKYLLYLFIQQPQPILFVRHGFSKLFPTTHQALIALSGRSAVAVPAIGTCY